MLFELKAQNKKHLQRRSEKKNHMIVAAVAFAGKQEVAKHSFSDFNFFGWLEIKDMLTIMQM